MIRILFLLAPFSISPAHAEEPGVCAPLPECNTDVLPDEEISRICSPEDVERCLIIDRRDCAYFVSLHGKPIAGGEYGYIAAPTIRTDPMIQDFLVIGNTRGFVELTTKDGTFGEQYMLSEMIEVSGKKLHTTSDHFAFMTRTRGRYALNTDGEWHKLPAGTTFVYNLRFARNGYQVAVDYQDADGLDHTLVANLRSTFEIVRK